ncbi:MAG: ABC transporter permease [Lachnospiraceae bacterium]|nr:ABC transporter permease [Lachnospiraceae bacterium]
MASSNNLTEEQIEALEVQYGLDKPIIVRYALWLADVARGDKGTSTRTYKPVSDMIAERIGPTLILTCTSLVLCLIVSLPLGVFAALKPGGKIDAVASGVAFGGTSVPSFFLGLLAIYLFAVKLNLLPTGGMYDSVTDKTLLSLIRHLIMPATIMAFSMTGDFIKQTKGSMLEVLNDEHVKTARSKGLKESRVVVMHILRNALIPIITCLSFAVPLLFGGSVVIEKIFNWPGLGSLMVLSIESRDYNAIMGITVLIAIAVMVANILLDILYARLDPRIAKEGAKGA